MRTGTKNSSKIESLLVLVLVLAHNCRLWIFPYTPSVGAEFGAEFVVQLGTAFGAEIGYAFYNQN
jgi:hypothetical protein